MENGVTNNEFEKIKNEMSVNSFNDLKNDVDVIKRMVIENSNDMDLGKRIRSFFIETDDIYNKGL